MEILKNDEVKKVLVICLVTFLMAFVSFSFLMNMELQRANKVYAKQNISLVGAILTKNPELEKEIIPIITKGKFEGNYEKGQSILSKYTYNENIEAAKNPITRGIFNSFIKKLGLLFMIFFAVIVFSMLLILKSIYKKLSFLGKVAEDMVEGKFHKESLNLREGEIATFSNKFYEMGERLESAVNSLREEKINLKNIINDISHQLKTPLASLITYNDILKNHEKMKKEDVDKFIELGSEQLDRMEWLIITLLKYARLESNVVKYNKEMTSLYETVEEAITPLLSLATFKNQEIVFEGSEKAIYYHDKRWLCEAISNIVKNSIEHTKENGKVEINIEETSLAIIISITDNGEGIKKSDIKNIFKRFYKGENSLNPKSIGIGLSLSKKIIEDHSGEIKVQSIIGEETTFQIIFLKTVI